MVTTSRTVAVALALVMVLVWCAFMRQGNGTGSAGLVEGGSAVPPDAETQSQLQIGVESEPRTVATDGSAVTAPESNALHPHASERATIHGRLVSAKRTPIADVPISLTGEAKRKMSPACLAQATPWAGVEAMSKPNGEFSIEFTPQDHCKYDLEVSPHALIGGRWSWDNISPGESLDLGTITLAEPGTIVGHLLSADGSPITGQEWSVCALRPWVDDDLGRAQASATSTTDKTTGIFEIREVPPGLTKLQASMLGTNVVAGPLVEVPPGDTVYVDVLCPIERVGSRISVILTCPPFGKIPSSIAPTPVVMLPGNAQPLNRPDAQSRSFTFDASRPGSYVIAVNDPMYVPWSSGDVAPGATIEARLQGSASVRISARDAGTGEAVQCYSVSVETHKPAWKVGRFLLLDSAKREPGDTVVGGLLPIEQTIIVGSPGFAEFRAEDLTLLPGEERQLRVLLSKGCTLAGSVRGELPASGVKVLLSRRRREGPARGEWVDLQSDDFLTVTAEQSGHFTFSQVSPGEYVLQAVASLVLHSTVETVAIAEGETPKEVVLNLPGSSKLRGRLLAPAGAPLDKLRVVVVPTGTPGTKNGLVPGFEMRERLAVRATSDGYFETALLPAGECAVSVWTPDTCIPKGYSGSQTIAGQSTNLGHVTLQPGMTSERQFDLQRLCPGMIMVSARLDGPSCSDAVVEISRVSEEGVSVVAGRSIQRGDITPLGPVIPGEYRLTIRAIDQAWYWVAPKPIHVSSGQEVAANCVVTLFDGTARVLRSDGAPTALTPRISVLCEAEVRAPRIPVAPDGTGNLHLLLPAGRYSLELLGPQSNPGAPIHAFFNWPLGGQQPGVITVQQ